MAHIKDNQVVAESWDPRGKNMTAKVITVTSGRRCWKTTATANLSAALADTGNKVVCIDADIGLRNLDVALGLENRIVMTLLMWLKVAAESGKR
jgi:septum formation inhibitor-activating ATPase MinD